MLGSIDKSLSELLKKTPNKTKVWFLSSIDSKKSIFRERRANGVAPTVCGACRLQEFVDPTFKFNSFVDAETGFYASFVIVPR